MSTEDDMMDKKEWEWMDLESGSPFWRRIWEHALAGMDKVEACPRTGECWQFMGCHKMGSTYTAEFRHRSRWIQGRQYREWRGLTWVVDGGGSWRHIKPMMKRTPYRQEVGS